MIVFMDLSWHIQTSMILLLFNPYDHSDNIYILFVYLVPFETFKLLHQLLSFHFKLLLSAMHNYYPETSSIMKE